MGNRCGHENRAVGLRQMAVPTAPPRLRGALRDARGRCGRLETARSASPAPLRPGPCAPLQPWPPLLDFAPCAAHDLRRSAGTSIGCG